MISSTKKIRLILALRQSGITNTEVLAAMEKVPRERFVPEAFRDRAYEDTALPIGHGQTVSQPRIVARMIEALAVNDRVKLLEVGTGSGYQTAILSHLCRRVYTVERHRGLSRAAERRFAALDRNNITAKIGDGALGWPEQAPFSHIIVSASVSRVPPVLADQLAVGGIMILPIGDERRDQRITRVSRGESGYDVDDWGPVRFLPLVAGLPGVESNDGTNETS